MVIGFSSFHGILGVSELPTSHRGWRGFLPQIWLPFELIQYHKCCVTLDDLFALINALLQTNTILIVFFKPNLEPRCQFL